MTVEEGLADHYASGDLLASIEAGVAALGRTTAELTVDDLAPVDEFHIGGRQATARLVERMEIDAGCALLDIGSGLGGTARYLAATHRCQVTGLDLTPEYVEVAEVLSDWTGLRSNLAFEVGSALDMPFGDDTFDRATQLHVGMNIGDKQRLFREVARVLRPGGRLGVYDIMQVADGDVAFPVPWATDAAMSFVASPTSYREALESAGFRVVGQRDNSAIALEFFDALRSRTAAAGGPPPLGLHLVMGPATTTKIANMVDAVSAGILAPVEIIAERPGG